MMIFGTVAAAVLALAVSASQTPWYADITREEFERVRSTTDRAEAAAAHRRSAKAFRDAALQARGHTGQTEYLEGCDVTDIPAEKAHRWTMAVLEASEYEDIAKLRVMVDADADAAAVGPASGPPQENLPAEIERRFLRDQTLRRALGAALPEGGAADLILQERFDRGCEDDLLNGRWLDQDGVSEFLATSEDRRLLGALATMALHADHLPQLQDRFSQILFVRSRSDPALLEFALRLKDQSLVNLGRQQLYGFGVICSGSDPVLTGPMNARTTSELREALGLPAFSLETLKAEGFCG